MPRTEKKKQVRKLPQYNHFVSLENNKDYGVVMKVEEYECIRLIDYEGCNQETCAAQMKVSRATVQMLYAQARKKLARFLVEGICLRIEGGDYLLNQPPVGALPGRCYKDYSTEKKEKMNMKIAVTYEKGQIFQHFGHTEQFKVYEVEDGKVVSSQVVDTAGQGHGALAGFLAEAKADVLICGGIGGGARNALAEAGIKLLPGAQGDADAQVESYLAGTLNYDPDTVCSHHGHGHEHGEDCGGHSHGDCGHHCG